MATKRIEPPVASNVERAVLQVALPAPPSVSATEARLELRRGLRLFKAFEQADKALAVLENIDQLTVERTAAAEAAKAAAAKACAERDAAEAAIAKAKADAETVQAKAKADAGAMLEHARAGAHEITVEATHLAAERTKQAKELADTIASGKKELKQLEAKIAEAQAIIDRASKLRAAIAEA